MRDVDPFVGRAEECSVLCSLWERVSGGHGGVLAVVGEQGIGKTRLVEELRHIAGTRAHILYASGTAAGSAPDGAWVVGVRTYASHPQSTRPAPDGIEALAGTDRFAPALTSWVRDLATSAPVLVVLDDLDRADRATLSTLRELAGAAKSTRLLIVCTRTDSVSLEKPREAQLIHVAPLDQPTVALLGERLLEQPLSERIVSELAEHTRGNTLFVRELLHLLDEEGCTEDENEAAAWIRRWQRVEDVIAWRLQSLDEPCRHFVELAAYEGEDFDLGALRARTADETERFLDRLDAAARAGLIGSSPWVASRYRFTHPLIRDAVRELAEHEATPSRRGMPSSPPR
jgi:predicted ATPase